MFAVIFGKMAGLSTDGYPAFLLDRFVTEIQGFKTIRTIGSAAIVLAHKWDIAAGIPMIRPTRGEVTAEGNYQRSVRVLASNGCLAAPAFFY